MQLIVCRVPVPSKCVTELVQWDGRGGVQSRHEGQPPTNPANPPTTTITDQPNKLSRPAWSVTLSGSHVVHTGVGRRNRGEGKRAGRKNAAPVSRGECQKGLLEAFYSHTPSFSGYQDGIAARGCNHQ